MTLVNPRAGGRHPRVGEGGLWDRGVGGVGLGDRVLGSNDVSAQTRYLLELPRKRPLLEPIWC